jgi:hypothetical protein
MRQALNYEAGTHGLRQFFPSRIVAGEALAGASSSIRFSSVLGLEQRFLSQNLPFLGHASATAA